MIKLLRYLKGYYGRAVIAPLFKLIEAISELIVPILIAMIIDNGIANGDEGYVIKYSLIVAALGLCGLLFATVCQYVASFIAMKFGTRIRDDMMVKVNSLSAREFESVGGASIVTRMSSDVTGCQNACGMFLRLVTRTPFVVVGAIVMAAMIDPVVCAIFVPVTVAIVGVLYLVMRVTSPRFKKAQYRLDRVTHVTRETLSGARVIRAFSNENKEIEKFNVASKDSSATLFRAGVLSAMSSPLTFAIINLGVIAVLWTGGISVDAGGLTQGEVTALVNYLMQIFWAVVWFANIILTFTRASACAARVNEVLDKQPSVKGGDEDSVDCNADPVLEFKDVCFAYEGDRDLDGATFTLNRGGTLGIIGGTGAGKSTVANLIARLYDPDSGEIKLCGKDIASYSLGALHSAVGVVPQKARLFSGTLRQNLLVGNADATDEAAIAALNTAQGGELIERIGLDGEIVEGGKNLSGGQKQRITIARTLMKQRALLILDDSSSALDFSTERRLYDALEAEGMTRIIISQRVSGVSGCDRILVLDGGKTVGYGTHEQLLVSCPTYKEFYELQTEATA